MGYFSDLQIDEQEHNAHVQDQEPDRQDYDQSYDEYKERKAGLFKEMGIDNDPELDFLDIGGE